MFKFAEKIVDISNDISGKVLSTALRSVSQLYGSRLPNEFKNMRIFTPEELSVLPDNDFALIFYAKDGDVYRRFPIPDIDNAIVSAIYLKKVYTDIPPTAAAIAARNILNTLDSQNVQYSNFVLSPIKEGLYEIRDLAKNVKGNVYREPKSSQEEELRKGQDAEISKAKTARASLKDSDFAFVTEKEGRKYRLFPINTVDNIKRAEAYFDSNYKLFSPEQRNIFAKAIQAKATELNHKIASANLSKYASCRWSPTIELSLDARIQRLRESHVKFASDGHYVDGGKAVFQAAQGYNDLKEKIGKCDIHKFASALYTLDKITGLTDCYDKTLSDAFVSTYDGHPDSFTEKTARVSQLFTMFGGKKITEDMLRSLDIGDLGGMIDYSTFEELKKDPINVFESLPIPYKFVILDALKFK